MDMQRILHVCTIGSTCQIEGSTYQNCQLSRTIIKLSYRVIASDPALSRKIYEGQNFREDLEALSASVTRCLGT